MVTAVHTELAVHTVDQADTQNHTHYRMTQPCHNIGNPVFSCMENPRLSPSKTLRVKQQSILFKTTSSEYGAVKPCREMAPCSHHPISQRFSEPLGICGMYRNHSLNTGVDRSQVHDCLNLQHTLE